MDLFGKLQLYEPFKKKKATIIRISQITQPKIFFISKNKRARDDNQAQEYPKGKRKMTLCVSRCQSVGGSNQFKCK